ncbi:hybrid sensor histidine kinase/response regulator [Curvivirga aplysinae]|uniref:hybrid sensor histidine kinase/response regulator n=1 Tax=Curvivirga aplysinae TaxID=2529852 RepID=UPI0012BC4E9E|nr:hybrid sensor histidine kinase/response regulator [Curvivirga aplysinae]MTI09177.1 hybrid sensor histidine kinase/response regulator [Curvivirga aplysinae]
MTVFKLNIIWKFIIYMIFLSILPILIVGGTSFFYSSRALKDQADNFTKSLIINQEELIELQIKQVEALSGQIASLTTVTDALNNTGGQIDSFDSLATKARIGYTLNGFLNIDGIVSIDLFSKTDTHFHVGYTLINNKVDESVKERLLKIGETRGSRVVWPGIEKNVSLETRDTFTLPAVRSITKINKETLDLELVGTIIVNLSVNHLHDQVSKTKIGEGGYFLIVDQNDRLIYHPDKTKIGSNYDLPIPLKKITQSRSSIISDIYEETYVLNHVKSANTGWHIISVIPESSFYKHASTVNAVTIFVIILCLSLVILIGLYLSRTIVAPIRTITESFKKYQKGKLDLTNRMEVSGSDEISELIAWYNAFLATQQQRQESELQLVRAKREAEKANNAKSEFLSSMSHELRTPLNSILGFAQLLKNSKRNPLSERQQTQMKFIIDGGEHLISLIDEVLDLAKIEAGKMTFNYSAISTCRLIRECLSFMNTISNDKNVTLIDETSEDVPNIWADPLRAKQILLNLLTNAVKYNIQDGKVWISTKVQNKDTLRIQVRDTGKGIPIHQQTDLFQPFSRLGEETKQIAGTGIGLFLSKKLITEMKGTIGVESIEGQGSIFWIDFPTTDQKDKEPVIEPLENTALMVTGTKEKTNHILYIEDNSANVSLMEDIIDELEDIQLTSVHTAELGIAFAEKEEFDIIILDINLPGMDGIKAVKHLKQLDKTKHIPAIALSANATHDSIQEALEAGFDEYLTKPLDVNKLIDALRKNLVRSN